VSAAKLATPRRNVSFCTIPVR